MTDRDLSTELVPDGRAAELIHPVTGEVLNLSDTLATELADELEDVAELVARLGDWRQAIVNELARRADARGARKVRLGGVEYEVNAPTEEVYDVGRLRQELRPLVDDGTIDAELLRELITYPTPKPPAPRVDKRRVNALKRSTDRRLLGALAAARSVLPQRRTAKVLGRAVDTTAEEA